jgi:hypothetical protein
VNSALPGLWAGSSTRPKCSDRSEAAGPVELAHQLPIGCPCRREFLVAFLQSPFEVQDGLTLGLELGVAGSDTASWTGRAARGCFVICWCTSSGSITGLRWPHRGRRLGLTRSGRRAADVFNQGRESLGREWRDRLRASRPGAAGLRGLLADTRGGGLAAPCERRDQSIPVSPGRMTYELGFGKKGPSRRSRLSVKTGIADQGPSSCPMYAQMAWRSGSSAGRSVSPEVL